jgi:tRNA threonylcarbamoyladenosine biosynthesis protein TsaE
MNVTLSLSELPVWIAKYMSQLEPQSGATVICLSGEVGAGKTTLTQSIAQVLGINEAITSPTFVIQKEYLVYEHTWIEKLIHIDAYRLEGKGDLEYLGWNTLITPSHNLVVIEWPSQVTGIHLPTSTIFIHIEINSDHTRTFSIKQQS